MVLGTSPPFDQSSKDNQQRMQSIALIFLGLLTGSLSGMLGIGGAISPVPALHHIFKLPMSQAVGTSLLIIIPAAVVGSFSHYSEGNLQMKIGVFVMIGAAVGGWLGANLVRHVPELFIKRAFA